MSINNLEQSLLDVVEAVVRKIKAPFSRHRAEASEENKTSVPPKFNPKTFNGTSKSKWYLKNIMSISNLTFKDIFPMTWGYFGRVVLAIIAAAIATTVLILLNPNPANLTTPYGVAFMVIELALLYYLNLHPWILICYGVYKGNNKTIKNGIMLLIAALIGMALPLYGLCILICYGLSRLSIKYKSFSYCSLEKRKMLIFAHY